MGNVEVTANYGSISQNPAGSPFGSPKMRFTAFAGAGRGLGVVILLIVTLLIVILRPGWLGVIIPLIVVLVYCCYSIAAPNGSSPEAGLGFCGVQGVMLKGGRQVWGSEAGLGFHGVQGVMLKDGRKVWGSEADLGFHGVERMMVKEGGSFEVLMQVWGSLGCRRG